jgi:hypothetical protein
VTLLIITRVADSIRLCMKLAVDPCSFPVLVRSVRSKIGHALVTVPRLGAESKRVKFVLILLRHRLHQIGPLEMGKGLILASSFACRTVPIYLSHTNNAYFYQEINQASPTNLTQAISCVDAL